LCTMIYAHTREQFLHSLHVSLGLDFFEFV